MHIILRGKNAKGQHHQRRWFIVALDGYGPYIPTIPAIILAKKMAQGTVIPSGARACVGLVTLNEYLAELKDYPVTTHLDT